MPVERARAAVRFLHSLPNSVIAIGGSAGPGRGLGQPVLCVKDILIGSMVNGIEQARVVRANNVPGRVIAPAIHLVLDGYGLIQRRIAASNVPGQQVTPDVVTKALPPVVVTATIQVRGIRREQSVQRIVAELLGARRVFIVDNPRDITVIELAQAEVIGQVQHRCAACRRLQFVGLHSNVVAIGGGNAVLPLTTLLSAPAAV